MVILISNIIIIVIINIINAIGGSTWTLTSAPSSSWSSIASNSAGSFLFAAQNNGGGIYTSIAFSPTSQPSSSPSSNPTVRGPNDPAYDITIPVTVLTSSPNLMTVTLTNLVTLTPSLYSLYLLTLFTRVSSTAKYLCT